MRKIALSLLCAVMLAQVPLRADEGMWLLPLLQKLNINKMQDLGLKLSAQDIYDFNNSSLKDAIVQFGGGCTGEIVSDKGLLFTNHHCGYGSIQALSSVEHDYLNNGYWAMNLSEELPAKGLTVTFIDRFTDVTAQIEKALGKAKTEEEKEKAYIKIKEKLEKEAVAADPTLDAVVTSFYAGNQYYLITSRTFKDIRFVGAPPSSIGKFGGDTDNWMWPRHTGDFSVFRVYADKNNNPAEYSKDNVPYTPKRALTISLKGVKENDYAMIMGFPGRTTRFMTSYEADETQHTTNPVAIKVRTVKQQIWREDMLADPKVNIQYASKFSGSSNGWKKWMGMDETFNKLKVIERRASDEAKFMEWVGKDTKRMEKYGKALETIKDVITKRKDAIYTYYYLHEAPSSIELIKASSPRYEGNKKDAFYKDYSVSTDKKLAVAMLKIYKENVAPEYLLNVYSTIDSDFGGSIEKYVDYLYSNSAYASAEKLTQAEKDGVDLKKDPAVILKSDIISVRNKLVPALESGEEAFAEAKKAYVAGVMEMGGNKPMYPDANFTLRVTYGSVLPYSPKDAVVYNYYTTLDGVMEKEDPNNFEFVVPAKLKELWKNKDFGRYAMPNGKLPVAFLSNNDITGGNSGSPVLNDKGELLGLAFDGNWEAMSGDIIFEPELQRCINVDVRYVLFIIDKFGGAGYLLDEMKIAE